MYDFIQGTLKEKGPLKAVVDVGGVGYRLSIPLNTYTRLPACDTKVLLFISHVVREDLQALYGFIAREERDLFEALTTISGIGPKTGLAIVGHMDIGAFHRAISAADTRLLSKIPGIGKKTAERLVIEMRDKVKKKSGIASATFSGGDSLMSDAVHALLNLGYNPMEAQKAVQSALQENKKEEDLGRLITAALQKI